jgi:hypothetical protein
MRREFVQIGIRCGSGAFRQPRTVRRSSPCSHRQQSVGLCSECMHARVVDSAKGSRFWRCARHADDPRFPKYPRLPVLICEGFQPAPAGEKP